MPKLNIMITGVAGFVGSNLAFNLIRQKKYNVIGVDNLEYGVREQIPAEVEFIQEEETAAVEVGQHLGHGRHGLVRTLEGSQGAELSEGGCVGSRLTLNAGNGLGQFEAAAGVLGEGLAIFTGEDLQELAWGFLAALVAVALDHDFLVGT